MMPAPTGNTDTTAVTLPTGRSARSTAGEFEALLSRLGDATSTAPESDPEDMAKQAGHPAPREAPKKRNHAELPAASEKAVRRAIADPRAASRALLAAREENLATGAAQPAKSVVATAARTSDTHGPTAGLQRGERIAGPLTRAATEAPLAVESKRADVGAAARTVPYLKDRSTPAPAEGAPQRDTSAPSARPRLKTRLAELPAMAATAVRTGLANQPTHKAAETLPADARAAAASPRTTLRAGFLGRSLDGPQDETGTARRAAPDALSSGRTSALHGDVRSGTHHAAGALRNADGGELAVSRQLGEITVTRREVHLPPVRRPASIETHLWQRQLGPDLTNGRLDTAAKPVFHAIAEQLTRTLEPMRNEAEAKLQQATQNALANARAYAPPVRIVELQLQPASLGALAVTMRLSGSGLRILVSATNRETADMLREDRDALAGLIEGIGYDASEIVVTHRPVKNPGKA